MARTSSLHGPRLDDQLKHEEHALLHGSPDEGRGEPRRAEAPGPGDEASIGVRSDVAEPQGGAPSQRDIEARAALAACFPPSLFPARRDRLIEEAEGRFADEGLMVTLRDLPDALYTTVGEVWAAIEHGVSGDDGRS
jgi:Protein of unknown function (DUF2795)